MKILFPYINYSRSVHSGRPNDIFLIQSKPTDQCYVLILAMGEIFGKLALKLCQLLKIRYFTVHRDNKLTPILIYFVSK